MAKGSKKTKQELDRLSDYTDDEAVDQLTTITEIPKQPEFYKIPRRFGSIPVDELPLGCDKDKQYYKIYPRVALPFQKADTVSFGHPKLESNRLFWGDNLHIMRMLPSNSIDLIYIDPPFFSGRNYNILFGDQNEVRSFTDIWEGGMHSYLIWLNARLLEMKRLLKPSGSIYVHLDSHAVHYVKTEMDKIFGYDNFKNEIIWKRSDSHPLSIKKFEAVTDTILFYWKSADAYFKSVTKPMGSESIDEAYRHKDEHGRYAHKDLTGGKAGGKEAYLPFNGTLPPKGRAWAPPTREKMPRWAQDRLPQNYESLDQLEKCHVLDEIGLIHWSSNKKPYFKRYLPENPTKLVPNLWDDIKLLSATSKEKIGYPTQKPTALLERIIKASSNEGDVVADFFCGGGTTPIVAQRLNRRWIACDQSRVAVAITQGRLEALHEKTQSTGSQQTLLPVPDISVEYWGTYEIPALEDLTDMEFRSFVVSAYGGRVSSGDGYVHGFKNQTPLFVGSPKQKTRVTKDTVLEFARDIVETRGVHKGVMLGWSFAPSARLAVEKLREEKHAEIDLIQITLIQIGADTFRSHITKLHEEYKSMLAFILPPEVAMQHRKIGPMQYEFDVSESIALNTGATIINVQWDFDYQGRFTPTQGFTYGSERKGDAIKPQFKVRYKFGHLGKVPIACRVQDDLGGEKIHSEIITVR